MLCLTVSLSADVLVWLSQQLFNTSTPLTRLPRNPSTHPQPIYNDFYMTLFNVVFTAAAPLVVGWFDRDLDKDAGLRFPFLYKDGE